MKNDSNFRQTTTPSIDRCSKATAKKFILGLTAVLYLTIAHGQISFQRTYGGLSGDIARSGQQTTDGGYIIAGTTGSFGAGSADLYLIKTNFSGDTIWTRTFGGTASENPYASVQQTTDTGFILVGTTNSFGAGGNDVYLLKTDANGNLLWSKTYGGSNFDIGLCVKQTFDGGYVIIGTTQSFGWGGNEIYVIKTDSNGNILWTKTLGGNNWDVGFSIIQTSDSGYVLTGYTQEFGSGADDAYLIKLNSIGTVVWAKAYGGGLDEGGFSVQETKDGGFIVTGQTVSFGVGLGDVFLFKTDSNGNLQWAKTYGGSNYEWGNYVQQTSDGGYVITGQTQSFGAGSNDIYLIKTDSTGNLIWSKTYGGSSYDIGFYVQETTDNGFCIIGGAWNFGTGGSDFILIKTDTAGTVGCNEYSATTFSTNIPLTIVQNGSMLISSGANTITPTTITNYGTFLTTLCSNVSIEDLTIKRDIINFPNPFSTQTTLQTDISLHNATLTVDNCFGQTVAQIKNISGQTITFSRDNLASGLYFLRLTDNEKIFTGKLVIVDN